MGYFHRFHVIEAAEAKASTSCTGGGWGKTATIREDEKKLVWAVIAIGAKGSMRLERRKIGVHGKCSHGPRVDFSNTT